MKRIAFFSTKSGVGKTTLAYHVAHRMVDLGERVLLVDLDPQSALTATCVSEQRMEELWPDQDEHPETILGSIQHLFRGIPRVSRPHVEDLREGLALVPGDLRLSMFEDLLSSAWAGGPRTDSSASFVFSAFQAAMNSAAEHHAADVVLIDVGPNLGAITRSALLAADFVITPLAPDLYSVESLHDLGETFDRWREGPEYWRRENKNTDKSLYAGRVRPLGYVVAHGIVRLQSPVRSYAKWLARLPEAYHHGLLGEVAPSITPTTEDPWCLGVMRNYQSLMLLARDAQKPMFHLKPGDGAIGAHMEAVLRCREDFDRLAKSILARADALSAQNT